jgi:hypothetical protein
MKLVFHDRQHPPDRGDRGDQFIREIKSRFTLSELPLTNHNISRVCSLRGITGYYSF